MRTAILLFFVWLFLWKPSGTLMHVMANGGGVVDYAIIFIPLVGLLAVLSSGGSNKMWKSLSIISALSFMLCFVAYSLKWTIPLVASEMLDFPKIVYIQKMRAQVAENEVGPTQLPIGARIRNTCKDCKIPRGAVGVIVEQLHFTNCGGERVFKYTTQYDNFKIDGGWCEDTSDFEAIEK